MYHNGKKRTDKDNGGKWGTAEASRRPKAKKTTKPTSKKK